MAGDETGNHLKFPSANKLFLHYLPYFLHVFF